MHLLRSLSRSRCWYLTGFSHVGASISGISCNLNSSNIPTKKKKKKRSRMKFIISLVTAVTQLFFHRNNRHWRPQLINRSISSLVLLILIFKWLPTRNIGASNIYQIQKFIKKKNKDWTIVIFLKRSRNPLQMDN